MLFAVGIGIPTSDMPPNKKRNGRDGKGKKSGYIYNKLQIVRTVDAEEPECVLCSDVIDSAS